ncbi:dethiobiotin synthase [Mycolicibacterium neworleansense]|uniref:ATP-dependent dethiobiotin synthetase BioD n=1 Tax=Mycolicibacterium neworleansense TaxID=146018 RepID=A0A0H5RK42_9MYCO|nr:dethiobiotin synthase [Mycolicibacterium neworleansense]MCV7360345.1 ATP-dependent dethiobiotin synthetase BioD [Mycolicibacterium neworleansense]CRZ14515.1 dithiobiotin synthetase [Mycolicibacterium neworleansense]
MSTLVVTGTDTGVGKTVTTAALACAARLAGLDVAVCKPVQTGTIDGDNDLGEVNRLSGADNLHGGWRYPEPLAPVAAAHRAGCALPTRTELVEAVRGAEIPGGLTVVEGAGGLLVELGADGVTVRDLAADLSAAVLVVVSPGLGTLNHTALTLESLSGQGIPCAGLVIGAWPENPGVAELGNREALARLAPVRAVLPAGAGGGTAEEFEALCANAFDRDWLTGLI